jgi:hypothetical protein
MRRCRRAKARGYGLRSPPARAIAEQLLKDHNGSTATAVIQETGAVAPEQATVRVTGTLRWDTTAVRRPLVETGQMPL